MAIGLLTWSKKREARKPQSIFRRLFVERLESRDLLSGPPGLATLGTFGSGDGANPYGTVIRDANGNLFGTTDYGGANGDGTVFEIKAGSSVVTTLAAFNGKNGEEPNDVVEDSNGNLFGTTTLGGNFSAAKGVVFEVKAGSNAITVLATFSSDDSENGIIKGTQPYGNVVLDRSGDLWGTTAYGGQYGHGTVFELKAGDSSITNIDSFYGANNGIRPQCGLAFDSNGDLFGTTTDGGLFGNGIIFEVPAGTKEAVKLYNFHALNSDGTNDTGATPLGGVIADSNGNIYGTTSSGGFYGDGTVFKLNNGQFSTLASFNGSNGLNPESALIMDASGNLFGTCYGGGANKLGTVFEVQANSNAITILASFGGVSNGAHPVSDAGLAEDANGNLYGTAEYGGANGDGVAFELETLSIQPSSLPAATVSQNYSQTLTAIGGTAPYTFTVSSGALPAGLSLSPAGVLSGTPSSAGTFNFTVTATDSSVNGAYTTGEGYTFTVNHGQPVLTWNPPAPISYGTLLGAVQLDATASVPGTFNYTPGFGTLLHPGQQTLSVTFTPSDTTDYTTAQDSTTITVNGGSATVTWPTPSPITYGTPLSSTQLDATASVPGTFSYSPPAGTVLHAGNGQTLSVTFTPTDGMDYSPVNQSVSINVTKATPSITWSNPADIVVGTALGPTQLDAKPLWTVGGTLVNVAGTFVYSPSAGTVLQGGTGQMLSVGFTPTDAADYTPANGNATINVVSAQMTLSSASITEFRPVGTVVGTFSVSEGGSGHTFVYSLASGTGSTGNASFTVKNNQLLSADAFDFAAQSSYNLRVSATDENNNTYVQTFVVAVIHDPNLSISGKTLTITGTSGNDVFSFTADPKRFSMTLNKVNMAADSSLVNTIVFKGGAGSDTAYLNGLTTGSNTLVLNPGSGSMTGPGYTASLASVETIQANGYSGDVAYLYDATGVNTFVATPTYGYFAGTGFYNEEVGFNTVNAYSASGTNDTAYLYDAGGSNAYVGTPTYSYFANYGKPGYFFNQAVGFRTVNASAIAASNDAAYLFDNGGTNTFVGTATSSSLQGTSYFNQVIGFKSVYASAGTGAKDTAYLSGAASGNVFMANTSTSYMFGPSYLNQVSGYNTVAATGSLADTANLYDGTGTNTFNGQGSVGTLVDGSLSESATGFGYVNIISILGSSDKAVVGTLAYTLTKSGTWH